MIARYVPIQNAVVLQDLNRPKTAVEKAEWRVQLAVRDLIVALVQQARQTHFCAGFSVSVAPWPSQVTGLVTADADLRVSWQPAQQQLTTWIPWLPQQLYDVADYQVFVARDNNTLLLEQVEVQSVISKTIPLLVFSTTAQRCRVVEQLRDVNLSHGTRPFLLTSLDLLQTPPGQVAWFDQHGLQRGLDMGAQPVDVTTTATAQKLHTNTTQRKYADDEREGHTYATVISPPGTSSGSGD